MNKNIYSIFRNKRGDNGYMSKFKILVAIAQHIVILTINVFVIQWSLAAAFRSSDIHKAKFKTVGPTYSWKLFSMLGPKESRVCCWTGYATIRGKKGSVGFGGQGDGFAGFTGLGMDTSLGVSGGVKQTRAE